MKDLKELREQAKRFAARHVAHLAEEIIEWQDTGLLRNGKLRDLASLILPMGHEHSLQMAENFAKRAALEAAWSRRPEGSAEGWKLVPVEPTNAMWDAAVAEQNRVEANWPGQHATCFQIWKAMIAASPVKAGQAEEFEEICREFEVDPNTGWGGICRQFYIRGRSGK